MKQEPDGFLTGGGRRVRGRGRWERGGMENKWGVEGTGVGEGKEGIWEERCANLPDQMNPNPINSMIICFSSKSGSDYYIIRHSVSNVG